MKNPDPSLPIVRGARVRDGLKERARKLRRRATPAERRFWEYVRNRQFPGLRCRRQQPVEGFVVDFYCDALRLVVELDGSVHSGEEAQGYDAERDVVLRSRGVRILRITNDEVLKEMPRVMDRILEHAK